MLGQIEAFVFDNGQQVLGIPSHWKINPNEPLKFDVKINERSQLILEGPLAKPSKIQNSQEEGVYESN
ncbi:MAG: hypothetical protein ACRD9Q_11605 [Nitrososphaeraceae archaeon]